jgi:phosphatidylglycerophosphate synthase
MFLTCFFGAGYVRALLLGVFIQYGRTDWQLSIICYSLGFVGDLFDGMAARYFNQCTALRDNLMCTGCR